jgi:hypothetical protein
MSETNSAPALPSGPGVFEVPATPAAPAPAAVPDVGNVVPDVPVVDIAEVRERAAKPEKVDPHPVVDLDKPIRAQVEAHRAAVREAAKPEPRPEPKPMPRSWGKEHSERWAKIDAATQDYLLERDAEISREVRTAQQERAEALTNAEATVGPERERAQQYATAYENAFAGLMLEHNADYVQMQQKFQAATPEQRQAWLASPEAAQWARNFEARHQTLQRNGEGLRLMFGEQQRQQEARQQQEFAQYGDGEDEKFQQAFPDLANDPDKFDAFQDHAVDYLCGEIGIPEDTISDLWTGASKLTGSQVVRSSEFQRVLHDAVQWRISQARLAQARPKIVPKPLQSQSYPGGGGGPSLQALAARGDMSAYIAARRAGQSR